MTPTTLVDQQPASALKQLVLVALLISILTQVVALLMIGQFDPEVILGLGFLVVAAALSRTAWRWAPALAALLAAIPIAGGLPYLLDHLAHPSALGFFATSVVQFTCALAAMIGGIGATVQHYREDRRTPLWLASTTGGLVGLAIGALLIGVLLANRTAVETTAASAEGPAIVHMGPVHFTADQVKVPRGETLRLVNDGAFPHVIANGAWNGSAAKPGREPDAPLVANVQVSGKDAVVEIGPFATPGTYQFYCTIHPEMQLTAIVQ